MDRDMYKYVVGIIGNEWVIDLKFLHNCLYFESFFFDYPN